jgi:hypothetical protein
MAWNISLMFVKADKEDVDNVISDVLGKTKENPKNGKTTGSEFIQFIEVNQKANSLHPVFR